MEHLMQTLWLNSVVLLLVSLGEIAFLYGLSREVRKVGEGVQKIGEGVQKVSEEVRQVGEGVQKISEEVRQVGEMVKEVAHTLAFRLHH